MYRTYTHRRVFSVQLWTRGYVIIMLHPGNPPLIEYSRDGTDYPNVGGFSPDSLEQAGKTVHSYVPSEVDTPCPGVVCGSHDQRTST